MRYKVRLLLIRCSFGWHNLFLFWSRALPFTIFIICRTFATILFHLRHSFKGSCINVILEWQPFVTIRNFQFHISFLKNVLNPEQGDNWTTSIILRHIRVQSSNYHPQSWLLYLFWIKALLAIKSLSLQNRFKVSFCHITTSNYSSQKIIKSLRCH